LTLRGIPSALSFDIRGRLAVGSPLGLLDIFDVVHGTHERSIAAYQGTRSITTAAFSPDGAFLAVAPSVGTINERLNAGPVRIWSTATWVRETALGSVKDNQTFGQVAWSQDGRLLSAVSFDGTLYTWRFDTRAAILKNRLPNGGTATAFSHDGTLAVAAGDMVLILK
jgi:WD40 repeat protein